MRLLGDLGSFLWNSSNLGDCQNDGPFLGPYYNTGPNTGPNLGDSKRDQNFDNLPCSIMMCMHIVLKYYAATAVFLISVPWYCSKVFGF